LEPNLRALSSITYFAKSTSIAVDLNGYSR
jgi:hypothetical protein